MTVRWLTPQEVVEKVNPDLQRAGLAELNVAACQVLGAWEGETLLEYFTLQLYPMLGPLRRLEGRDAGGTSLLLAETMYEYAKESSLRGALLVADSPLTARLAERFGMSPLRSPVYSYVQTSGGV